MRDKIRVTFTPLETVSPSGTPSPESGASTPESHRVSFERALSCSRSRNLERRGDNVQKTVTSSILVIIITRIRDIGSNDV